MGTGRVQVQVSDGCPVASSVAPGGALGGGGFYSLPSLTRGRVVLGA